MAAIFSGLNVLMTSIDILLSLTLKQLDYWIIFFNVLFHMLFFINVIFLF